MATTCASLQPWILLLTAILGCVGFQFPQNGAACIILNMDANFTLIQIQEGVDVWKIANSTLRYAKVNEGFCATEGDYMATLNLDTTIARLSFGFVKTVNQTVLMDIMVMFDPDDIFRSNQTEPIVTTGDGSICLSEDTMSYNCSEEREIQFVPVNASMFFYEFRMTIRNVVIQAFNIKNGTLSQAEYCQAEQSTTAVLATTFGETSVESTTQPYESTVSTEVTSSVTVAPTTPSVIPVPRNPPVQTYSVKGRNGTCILMTCGIQFTIKYKAIDEQKTKVIGVPQLNQLTVSGNCDSKTNSFQSIDIKFYDDWNIRIQFYKYDDQTTEKYFLSEIDLTANLNKELFPDIENPGLQNVAKNFSESKVSASVQGSYRCTRELEFILNKDISMDTFNLQFAAFQQNITEFRKTDLYQCKNDVNNKNYITRNIIIAAVSSGSGLMIAIATIALLIRRRYKSKTTGEESLLQHGNQSQTINTG